MPTETICIFRIQEEKPRKNFIMTKDERKKYLESLIPKYQEYQSFQKELSKINSKLAIFQNLQIENMELTYAHCGNNEEHIIQIELLYYILQKEGFKVSMELSKENYYLSIIIHKQ